MEFWITVLSISALIALFPYLRCLAKRLSAAIKLKKACKKANIKLYPAHFLWFLGSRSARGCDFYIETQREIICVKFFGVKNKLADLVFTSGGKYFIRKYIAIIAAGGGILYPIEGKQHPVPDYDFRRGFRAEWELKTPRRILLVNPVCNEIKTKSFNGTEQITGSGQIINNFEIQTLSHLIGELHG